jgi:purine-nucleoside phosphorylase
MMDSCAFIRDKFQTQKFDVALILGSGQKDLAYQIMTDPQIIDYHDIPHFPPATNLGHGNDLCYGLIHGKKVLAFTGRIHPFEGYRNIYLQYIVQMTAYLECELLITTNAAGGIGRGVKEGEFIIVDDCYNGMCKPVNSKLLLMMSWVFRDPSRP